MCAQGSLERLVSSSIPQTGRATQFEFELIVQTTAREELETLKLMIMSVDLGFILGKPLNVDGCCNVIHEQKCTLSPPTMFTSSRWGVGGWRGE